LILKFHTIFECFISVYDRPADIIRAKSFGPEYLEIHFGPAGLPEDGRAAGINGERRCLGWSILLKMIRTTISSSIAQTRYLTSQMESGTTDHEESRSFMTQFRCS
jgi:hypothetical protein